METAENGAVNLTVADPDFGKNWRINGADPAGKNFNPDVNFENAPGSLQVVLQGQWQGDVPGGSLRIENGNTRLTIPSADGAAVAFSLKPLQK